MCSRSVLRRRYHWFHGVAENLHPERPFEFIEVQLFDTLHAVADQAVRRDELGIYQIGPEQLAHMAEGRV